MIEVNRISWRRVTTFPWWLIDRWIDNWRRRIVEINLLFNMVPRKTILTRHRKN